MLVFFGPAKFAASVCLITVFNAASAADRKQKLIRARMLQTSEQQCVKPVLLCEEEINVTVERMLMCLLLLFEKCKFWSLLFTNIVIQIVFW